MSDSVSNEALRVLGVLIDKELSTPDYYPMTVNGIVNGCNQKSNRQPVVSYGEITVLKALDDLFSHRIAGHASVAGSRSEKYRHAAAQRFDLDTHGLAVMASLILRGPQTVGELRSHTSRMATFESMDEVEGVLDSLSEREEPLVARAGRQAGQKGIRFCHLLAGEPVDDPLPEEESAGEAPSHGGDLDEIRERLDKIEAEFEAFRKQFE